MEIRDLTRAEMKAIASWRYPGPYSTYEFNDDSVLARDHWAVTDAGELIGYCCFGEPVTRPRCHRTTGDARHRIRDGADNPQFR